MIYLLTAIGLTPGGSSTVHIYTQTVHRTAQLINWEECGPCPVFASYTLAFALQVRKKHEKIAQIVVNFRKRWFLYSRLPLLMHSVSAFTVGSRSADIQGLICRYLTSSFYTNSHAKVTRPVCENGYPLKVYVTQK